MLESQRLAYLKTLGIPQYVARVDISGAPSLPELSWDQVYPASEQAEPAQAEATAVPHSESILQAVQSTTKATVVSVIPEPAPEPAVIDTELATLDISKLGIEPDDKIIPVKSAPSTRVERFAMAVLTLDDQYRLVFELGVADAPGFSAIEHRMVSDLLRALGYGDWLNQSQPKLFRWPFVNNPKIAADAHAAKEGLMAFFESAPHAANTLFFGHKAAGLLGAGEPGQTFEVDQFEGQALFTHSLIAMQNDVSLKRPAWDHIRGFVSPKKRLDQ